jgi:hypothetical protein
MTPRATNTLADWSVRAYPLVLHVYPSSFKAEFGEPMSQIFADLVRAACRERGLPGLAVLWMRTVVDVVITLIRSYAAAGTPSLLRPVVIMGLMYVCALTATTAYGGFRYREFYETPSFNVQAIPSGASESVWITRYVTALDRELGAYRRYVRRAGLALAVWLGITAALFGRWQRSIAVGIAALVAGIVLTVAAFETMPSIWFPFDRYAVGFTWMLGAVPVAALAWTVVTLASWFTPRPQRLQTI